MRVENYALDNEHEMLAIRYIDGRATKETFRKIDFRFAAKQINNVLRIVTSRSRRKNSHLLL